MDTINQSHEIKSILRALQKRCYFKEVLYYLSPFTAAAQPSYSNLLATSSVNCECVRNVKTHILRLIPGMLWWGEWWLPEGYIQVLMPEARECDLMWKMTLCRCNQVKDLKWRSYRIIQIGLKSKGNCLYKREARGYWRQVHVNMEPQVEL